MNSKSANSSNIHVQQLRDWLCKTIQGIDSEVVERYIKSLKDNMITSRTTLANVFHSDNTALDDLFHRFHLPDIKNGLLKLHVS